MKSSKVLPLGSNPSAIRSTGLKTQNTSFDLNKKLLEDSRSKSKFQIRSPCFWTKLLFFKARFERHCFIDEGIVHLTSLDYKDMNLEMPPPRLTSSAFACTLHTRMKNLPIRVHHGAANALLLSVLHGSLFAHLGILIYAKEVKFHTRHHDALTLMVPHTTSSALMQLFHGANWMGKAIPDFSEKIKPLHNLLEAITNKSTFEVPDALKRLCLLTDASSTHWSGVLTQIDPFEILEK
eukprot:IDg5068t1